MNESYYIGQLARLAGVTVQTLRYYEKRGLVFP
ncbi:MAG: MerR family DNA-binding transcriptional regulator, partial [Thermodesulfobacteriota bacterium]